MSKKCTYFSSLFDSYMMFGSVANSFRGAFLRGIECFLLRKNISNFAEATREKRFTTMTPLGMSRDVTCHRLWRHNCFSNSIQFELIYFISIWTSQNLLKIRTFLCIIKRKRTFRSPLVHLTISILHATSYSVNSQATVVGDQWKGFIHLVFLHSVIDENDTLTTGLSIVFHSHIWKRFALKVLWQAAGKLSHQLLWKGLSFVSSLAKHCRTPRSPRANSSVLLILPLGRLRFRESLSGKSKKWSLKKIQGIVSLRNRSTY